MIDIFDQEIKLQLFLEEQRKILENTPGVSFITHIGPMLLPKIDYSIKKSVKSSKKNSAKIISIKEFKKRHKINK